MANIRRAVKGRIEGLKHIARFRHPVLGRVVRFDLGADAQWRENLRALNTVFLNEACWFDPPATVPDCIRRQWDPRDRVTVNGQTVRKGAKILPADKKLVARLTIERDALKRRVEELLVRLASRDREIEHWRGKKLAPGPVLTVQEAKDAFMKSYNGDPDHVKQLGLTLQKATDHFKPQQPVSKLTELEINSWLKGLKAVGKDGAARPIGGARRNFVRTYLLKMLADGGAVLNRKLIETASAKSIKRQRGAIKWLSHEQAESVAAQLSSPWREMWQVQCAVGLRPSELLTLQKSNFASDLSQLTLSPMGALSLKTGSRTIPIPSSIRPLLELRLKGREIVFSDPNTGKAWSDPKNHAKRYVAALDKAAVAAGVVVKMGANIGRKTCASLLLQSNVSAEKISALLGNSPSEVLASYGNPDIEKLDLEKNCVGVSQAVG